MCSAFCPAYSGKVVDIILIFLRWRGVGCFTEFTTASCLFKQHNQFKGRVALQLLLIVTYVRRCYGIFVFDLDSISETRIRESDCPQAWNPKNPPSSTDRFVNVACSRKLQYNKCQYGNDVYKAGRSAKFNRQYQRTGHIFLYLVV